MVKYEFYNPTPDYYFNPYLAQWIGQTFTIGNTGLNGNVTLDSVKLFAYRWGLPGTISVAIKATTDGKPSGDDISTGTFNGDTLGEAEAEWFEINMSAVVLSRDTKYALIVKCLAGDWNKTINLQGIGSVTPGTYTGGTEMSTEDSGANWTAYPLFDCNFEIWGTAYTVGDLTITTQMYDTMALAIAAIDTDTHPATTDHHNINILPGGQGMKSISVLKYVRSAT